MAFHELIQCVHHNSTGKATTRTFFFFNWRYLASCKLLPVMPLHGKLVNGTVVEDTLVSNRSSERSLLETELLRKLLLRCFCLSNQELLGQWN